MELLMQIGYAATALSLAMIPITVILWIASHWSLRKKQRPLQATIDWYPHNRDLS